MGVHGVVLVGLHTLGEKVRNPLGNVQLVLLIIFGTQLQYFVYQPANSNHGRPIGQVMEHKHWILTLKWVDEDIHKQIQYFELAEVPFDLPTRNSITLKGILFNFVRHDIEHKL